MADRPGASSTDSDPLSPLWPHFPRFPHFPLEDDYQPSPDSSPTRRSEGSLGLGSGHVSHMGHVPAALATEPPSRAWSEDLYDVSERTLTRLVGNVSLGDVRPRSPPLPPLPPFPHQHQGDPIASSSCQSHPLTSRLRQNYFPGLPHFHLNPSEPSPMTRDLNRLSTTQHHRVGQLELRRMIGTSGRNLGDFQFPTGICIGLREEILVADTNNHRIQIFYKNGDFKHVFGVKGKEDGYLWYPRKLGVLKESGAIVVCDRGKGRSRLQVFDEAGCFLKSIQIGNIEIASGLAITSQGNIALVDSVRPAIHILDPIQGDQLNYIDLREKGITEPSDIAISEDQFFICDFKGHQFIHLDADGAVIGKISTEFISKYPNGIDVSDAGDILISDSHGNSLHVAVFNNQKQFLSHYECPSIQVSRCCGLRILSDGHIVTLAKNNDHVLIMDTIYV